VRRLLALGVTVQQFARNGVVRGETYRGDAPLGAASDTSVRATKRVQIDTVPTLIDAPSGSYYVPLAQPLAHLAIAALEPDTASSYTRAASSRPRGAGAAARAARRAAAAARP